MCRQKWPHRVGGSVAIGGSEGLGQARWGADSSPGSRSRICKASEGGRAGRSLLSPISADDCNQHGNI